MQEIWTRKIWNSLVFILLFEVLSGLQLDSDSQYFLKFDTHTFSNILHICNHRFSPSISMWRNMEGGWILKSGGGEHLMFVCRLPLPFDPYSRDEEAATTKILDNNWKENVFSAYLYMTSASNTLLAHFIFGDVSLWLSGGAESFVCSWNLVQLGQH